MIEIDASEGDAIPVGPIDAGDTDRRSAMGLLGKGGVGLLASAAFLLRSQDKAGAHENHYACCHLANPHDSGCRCASGTLRSWTCCSGTSLYSCIECWDQRFPQPSSCWSGYFYCSRGVNLSTRC